ncbi:MAG TPA: HAD family hydrolase [Myxococcales bacterium]|nr:HAD family hydrolase [Myxococcales bacterium]
MKRAAFFDLDGTLLTVNSANLWVRRERRLGKLGAWQVARAGLFLAGYRLGFLDMEGALRAALATLRDVEEEEIRRQTREWWRDEVRPFIAPGAKKVLDDHRVGGDALVLLTSSSPYASENAHAEFGLDAVLCQHYEVRDGRFTGEPLRPICYGPGKVEVAERWARENGIDLAASAFYTDSSTDVPMLERVGRPFVVNPDPRLRLLARSRRWTVLDWR